MRTLVLGGIRSGKSGWAESVIAQSAGAVRYLATGAVDDDPGWAQRIAAHRARRPRRVDDRRNHRPDRSSGDEVGAALVDDLGGWLTAVMDRRGAFAGGSVAADVDELLDAVRGFAGELVLVSPEVGLTVVPATAAGRRFADELGTLNQRLAAVCERVVLVVAGQPVPVKAPTAAESPT